MPDDTNPIAGVKGSHLVLAFDIILLWKYGKVYINMPCVAGVAQLVEHLIRNEGVVGSSPITGTRIKK